MKEPGPSPATRQSAEEPSGYDVRASPSSGEPAFRGVAHSGWSAFTKELSDQDLTLLHGAWRSSTWDTYKSAWKQWLTWCSSTRTEPDDPTPQILARYISFLYHQGKAPSTVLLHKSVVISLANPEKANAISAHPIVRSMLKAVATFQSARNGCTADDRMAGSQSTITIEPVSG